MIANLDMTATHRWVQDVFGVVFTGQKFERGVWVPILYVGTQEIRLRPYATRQDFLDVNRACGGQVPSDERVRKACVQKG